MAELARALARRYLYSITVTGSETKEQTLELIEAAWQAGFAEAGRRAEAKG